MNSKNNDIILFSIILIIIFILQACNAKEVKSSWCNLEIVADGNDCDWKSYNKYYDKDTRTMTGFVNNENDLYIFMSSHDQRIKRQILESGLTVWFDPEGGKEKKLGVRFPVGMPHFMRNPMVPDRLDRILHQSEKMSDIECQRELQLLGPGEGEQKTLLASDVHKYDINVMVREIEGNFVYELKIPLTLKDQIGYAVKTDFTKSIGVGFETGDSDVDDMPGRFKGMGGGHGDTGGGGPPRAMGVELAEMGGGPPPGGKRGRTRQRNMPEPLGLWLSVKLAPRS